MKPAAQPGAAPEPQRLRTAPEPRGDGSASADLVVAIDRAVADGVDVLSVAAGGPAETDTVERALLTAAEADVATGSLAGADVVDLGCGEGELARWAIGKGAASVLALDLDPDRLDRARAAATPAQEARIHIEQADLEQATLPFEAYDVATCAVLGRLADPVRFARMVRAGLRPGARLVALLDLPHADRVAALERGGLALVSTSEVALVEGTGVLVVARKPVRGR